MQESCHFGPVVDALSQTSVLLRMSEEPYSVDLIVVGTRGSGEHSDLVLPHAHDQPSRLRKLAICVPVPADVATDLLGPVVAVCLGRHEVIWARVSEAAVEEHGDPRPGKHEIRRAPQTLDGPRRDAS
jgi:hypothetical protein